MKNMNLTFDWNRFLCLCKREFTEGRTQWLRWLVLLSAILFVFSGGGLALFGGVVCVASALLMPGIADRQKRVFYLMIPASPLEKLLSRYTYIMSLILVAYPLAALIAGIVRLGMRAFFGGPSFLSNLYSAFSLPPGESIGEVLVAFFTLQVVFMLGSMIWLKNSFFKTVLFHVLFGAILLMAILIVASISSFYAGGISGPSEIGRLVWSHTLFRVIHILMLVFFYVLCYFRFRELGIVHKLIPLTLTMRILLTCYALLLLAVSIVIALWFYEM